MTDLRLGTAIVAAVCATVALGIAGPAAAAPAAPVASLARQAADPAPTPPAGTPTMGEYAPETFAAAAAQLPADLTDAVQRDLGVTPEEYLSDAAAATDAAAVVSSLKKDGVDVVASRIDGTDLHVTVASSADVAPAEATGATVTVGSAPPAMSGLRLNAAAAPLLGGTAWGYLVDANSGERCSIGFNGTDASNQQQFVTAGHCVQGTPYSSIMQIVQSRPSDPAAQFGATIGSPVAGTFRFGGGFDSGRIAVTSTAFAPQAAISTWGGAQGAPTASSLGIKGDTTAVVGASMCKSGSSSGWTCGKVLAVDAMVDVDGQDVNEIISDACVLKGDSGGSAVVGAYALGVTSASSQSDTCGSGQLGAFFPLRSSASPSVASQQPGWKLSVAVSAPVPSVHDGSTVFAPGSLTGTVAGGNAQTTVSVYYDGRTDASGANTTATVSSAGAWSVPLPTTPGKHTYRLVSRWGTTAAATSTGTITTVAKPAVARLSGSDRFDTAVQISRAGFPGTAKTVVVASGVDFPDALSAAPAAVALGAPLLLTMPGALPASIAAEIARLKPTRIIVVGGVNAVSAGVAKTLSSYGTVTRLAGGDRYETSRKVTAFAFGSAKRVYIATGTSFPDALSAGAAAGAFANPVVLVPGYAAGADAATSSLISKLGATSIAVVGGPVSVSNALATSLGRIAPVTRLGGSDRFETAQVVNKNVFSSDTALFVASGVTFPDALAGSALAGAKGAPLYVVPTGCVAQSTVAEVGRLGATAMTVLGGTAALSSGISSLSVCP
ncbi:cell wall-binding repeat-containing protein [Leifsonia sp. PS1209]|uniref:cell wall-binding repeat-containing protein n=1 Tax=Leifsonia sp. PS1209 TaxID=2724914 RepID=UPI001442C20D|nr:cell wall-binding repeat-containing protein [Leifsonia sp. PS1209]QIZ97956.1 hypothetical protein HF024_05080 [Leifsonia sp. PS1209]